MSKTALSNDCKGKIRQWYKIIGCSHTNLKSLNCTAIYAHYAEPREVLAEAEDEILARTAEYIQKIGAQPKGAGKDFIASFLRYIRENDKAFRVLLVTAADP